MNMNGVLTFDEVAMRARTHLAPFDGIEKALPPFTEIMDPLFDYLDCTISGELECIKDGMLTRAEMKAGI
jgi:hypothetical protein